LSLDIINFHENTQGIRQHNSSAGIAGLAASMTISRKGSINFIRRTSDFSAHS
jgi:hypothetical protein